ncbi:MAG: NAD(P)H-binding protein [Candidatus Latescibacterota bacterium]
MKILITGATGFTGKRVLPLLRGRGAVRCLVRPGGNAELIARHGYEASIGDLGDVASLTHAMSGCDALINLASIGFGHTPGIIRASEKAGIRRVVFISTTAIFTKLNASSKQIRTQAEAHIQSSNLEWTILRPTMIYGAPDDRNIIRLIKFLDRFPAMPVLGNGGRLQQPVYVEDVAKAAVDALFNEGTQRRAFNISGKRPNTFNEVIDITAAALGKKIRKVRVPYKLALFGARVYEALCPNPRIKAEQVMRINEDKAFDHSEAQCVFGFDPRSFEDGIREEVGLYRAMQGTPRRSLS